VGIGLPEVMSFLVMSFLNLSKDFAIFMQFWIYCKSIAILFLNLNLLQIYRHIIFKFELSFVFIPLQHVLG